MDYPVENEVQNGILSDSFPTSIVEDWIIVPSPEKIDAAQSKEDKSQSNPGISNNLFECFIEYAESLDEFESEMVSWEGIDLFEDDKTAENEANQESDIMTQTNTVQDEEDSTERSFQIVNLDNDCESNIINELNLAKVNESGKCDDEDYSEITRILDALLNDQFKVQDLRSLTNVVQMNTDASFHENESNFGSAVENEVINPPILSSRQLKLQDITSTLVNKLQKDITEISTRSWLLQIEIAKHLSRKG